MSQSSTSLSDQLNHLRNIIAFRDLMLQSDLNIVYLGKITQNTINGIVTMTEEDMSGRNEHRQVYKRVYHVMIEALQNICKHADNTSDDSSDSLEEGLAKEGIFLIGNNENEYFITTGNQIPITDAIRLRGVLDDVNALDKDALKKRYMAKMESTMISDKGGAGLGFLDMAKKTGTKFEYYFEPLDDEKCFFILTIRVAKLD